MSSFEFDKQRAFFSVKDWMCLYCPTFTDFVFLDNSFPLRCTLTVSIPNKVDSDKLAKLICNLKILLPTMFSVA